MGNKTALDIYNFLLNHTVSITHKLNVTKVVYYSEEIWEDDVWKIKDFTKKLQKGIDLGERMTHAFKDGFKAGFDKICIIGSDMYDLSQQDIENAFSKLENHDFVIGPADDGGYYLLGMTQLLNELFQDKAWGTGTVLKHTLENLEDKDYTLLDTRNDVDLYEDIEDIEAFQPFLKHLKKWPKNN